MQTQFQNSQTTGKEKWKVEQDCISSFVKIFFSKAYSATFEQFKTKKNFLVVYDQLQQKLFTLLVCRWQNPHFTFSLSLRQNVTTVTQYQRN